MCCVEYANWPPITIVQLQFCVFVRDYWVNVSGKNLELGRRRREIEEEETKGKAGGEEGEERHSVKAM